jgi:hypothetical protein
MTKKQQSILDSIPAKRHDPDGVTAKMVMAHTGLKRSGASRLMKQKVDAGDAVPCWVWDTDRFVPAIKTKMK